MRSFFRNNSLSLTLFFVFFLPCIAGLSISGLHNYNHDRTEHVKAVVSYGKYLQSSEFLEALAENWESEFLQLCVYVWLTGILYQKGSAESKEPSADNDKEEEEKPSPASPWPVRRGGWVARIYNHSLSLSFLILLISFLLHAAGGASEYNMEQTDHNQHEQVSIWMYMATSKFWFESLQNWQSEFIAIWAVVIFSIFLREKNSPESKPVTEPHWLTGK